MFKKNDIIYVKKSLKDLTNDRLKVGYYKIHRIDERDYPPMVSYHLIPLDPNKPLEPVNPFAKNEVTTVVFESKVLENYADIVTEGYKVLYEG